MLVEIKLNYMYPALYSSFIIVFKNYQASLFFTHWATPPKHTYIHVYVCGTCIMYYTCTCIIFMHLLTLFKKIQNTRQINLETL